MVLFRLSVTESQVISIDPSLPTSFRYVFPLVPRVEGYIRWLTGEVPA